MYVYMYMHIKTPVCTTCTQATVNTTRTQWRLHYLHNIDDKSTSLEHKQLLTVKPLTTCKYLFPT